MRTLRALVVRLGGLFRTGTRERDIDEEIESHVRMHAEDGVRRGLSPEEARRQAVLDLGGIQQTRERMRDRGGLPALEALWHDARHGMRLMRKNPGFSLVAILTLALGIGANTAIFSVVNGVLLRPLPYGDPERIVQLWHVPPPHSFPGLTRFNLSAGNYLSWRERNHSFHSMAAYGYGMYTFNAGDRPEPVQAARIAPDFFAVLGVKSLLGRTFTGDEDVPGRGNVVILSHQEWKSRFASDPGIVGREIRLDGVPRTVVGVMPPGFKFPDYALIWVPLGWDDEERAVRGNHNYRAIARLKEGVALATAQAELSDLSVQLEREFPEDNRGWGAVVVPLRQELTGEVRPALFVLFGAVGFVLLIASANLANLLLSRTLDRRKEIALRAALGASRGRVLRQLLCETVLLALIGGALGLVVAGAGVDAIVAHFGDELPRAREVALDGRVLLFTLLASILTGIAAGTAPAWRLTKTDLNEALKQGLGRTAVDSTGGRTRDALLVAQIALSLVLLIGAGLMVRTLALLRDVDPGFDAQNVVSMTLDLPGVRYNTPEHVIAFFDGVLDRVRVLPGVEAAGAVTTLPMGGGGSMQPIAIEGRAAVNFSEQPEVAVREITPGYFRTMRIPVLRGRDVTQADGPGAPAVIFVSASMAGKFWPGEDPIGKRLVLSFRPGVTREIVGVVGDVKQDSLSAIAPAPTLYSPVAQTAVPGMSLVVRSTTAVSGVINPVTAAIRQVDPELAVVETLTLQEIMDQSLSHRQFSMMLLSLFAGLALVLAIIGIYSVLSYTVRRRVPEIGIRMALGARQADVLRMVLGQGLHVTLLGLGLGILAALGLTRLLSGLLFGVRATDPATFAGVAALLCAVALVACYIPARRASRVDPLKALRQE